MQNEYLAFFALLLVCVLFRSVAIMCETLSLFVVSFAMVQALHGDLVGVGLALVSVAFYPASERPFSTRLLYPHLILLQNNIFATEEMYKGAT